MLFSARIIEYDPLNNILTIKLPDGVTPYTTTHFKHAPKTGDTVQVEAFKNKTV